MPKGKEIATVGKRTLRRSSKSKGQSKQSERGCAGSSSRATYFCESDVCALTIACFGQHSRNYIVGAKSMVGLYPTALSK